MVSHGRGSRAHRMAAAFHKDSRRFARGNVRAKHFGIAVGPDRHWVETGNWTATGYNRPEPEIDTPNPGARNRPFGSARRIALRLLICVRVLRCVGPSE